MSGRYDRLRLVCPDCRVAVVPEDGGVRCPACAARYPEEHGVLRLTAGAQGGPGYDPHYFGSLPEVEGRHFWFLARREVILDGLRAAVPDLASRPLVDIGCGTGSLLAFLAASGVPVAGACDAYPEGLALTRRRVEAPLVRVDEGRLPPFGPGQALLGLFDVLEHIDDDRGTLSWLASVLEPGGYLVLTVPAHPFLFDEMDELACHRRRYTAAELRGKLEGAGLRVVRLTHFMAPLVPGLIAARSLGRWLGAGRDSRSRRDAELRVVPLLNGALRALLRAERSWLRLAPLPFGTSILALARRPEAPV
jgi:SAM-dependent methyltransferase